MMRVPSRAELRRRRLELGLTQRELAEAAGVSQPLVARIETGSVDPRVSTLTKIVDVLNRSNREPALTAQDLMSRPVMSVRSKETVRRAAALMNRGGFSILPIIEKGRLLGAITERRLVEEMSNTEDLDALSRRTVSSFAQPAPPQVGRDTDVETLSRLLEDNPLVLVADRGRALGVVTKADLLRTLGKATKGRASS